MGNNEKRLLVVLVITSVLALFCSQFQLRYSITFSMYTTGKEVLVFKPKRKFLVFSNVGKRGHSALNSWLSESTETRTYDLVLNFFETDSLTTVNCPGDFCFQKNGFKWPSLHHFLIVNQIKENDYKAVFAIDDDILIKTEDINILFRTFVEHDLMFAQPSYAGNVSDLHFPRIQRWRGNTIIRYSNFVENAAMVIKFPVLMTKLLPIMKISNSGWGIDYCFFKIADVDILDVGTIHTVRAAHPPTKQLTKASNAYGVESERLNKYGAIVAKKNANNLNRIQGEELMKKCGAFLYLPKIFFRISPKDERKKVIQKQLPDFPKYRGSYYVKSPW